jgi:twitching motility protein PilU
MATTTAPGTMERILRLMSDKMASDVYLSAHSPALIKINGLCIPINNQVLPPDAPRTLLAEVLPAERMVELETTGELNMGFPLAGIGRFRVSAGSGKSTSLASMIDFRNEALAGHILTIEDPIEFLFKNKRAVINQREIGTDTESLQVALKNALRQAPDVILIGEIRDRETMSAALAYAQSGHLCLATMHANNSYQALNRILSFYPVEVRQTMLGDLAAALKAVMSQRLLRTVSGTRAPSVEVLLNTKLISELIEKGDFSGVKEALEKSMAEGSQSFEADIARMIMDGTVDRKEGLANADSPTNLMWRMQNDFAKPVAPQQQDDPDDEPSFTEITLDVKH